ncbi:MAG: hypothetical protein JSW47_12245 [Phycisphaerales bacterium]|nr:MAG: hypothetical protein JSW47_12245 [Phycisphaerales bacterium]
MITPKSQKRTVPPAVLIVLLLASLSSGTGLWRSTPADSGRWNPLCDISDERDGTIDEKDLAAFAHSWLNTTTWLRQYDAPIELSQDLFEFEAVEDYCSP